jgi:hypothetical protein
VLLVDDHRAERRELDAFLDQRMGADQEVDVARREPARAAGGALPRWCGW